MGSNDSDQGHDIAVNHAPNLAENHKDIINYARKEGDSFMMAKGAIEALLKNTSKDITWIELRKHKVPFATRKIGMLCNRVSELHFMKPDPRKAEKA